LKKGENVMKKITNITVALFFIILLTTNLAGAEQNNFEKIPDNFKKFYNEHIDMKIEAAARHSAWAENEDPDLSCMGKVAQMEKEFYEKNRGKLVKEMYDQGIGKEGMEEDDMYKVHYYLINAFYKEHPDAMTKCLKRERMASS
jgi:hypothetical protein